MSKEPATNKETRDAVYQDREPSKKEVVFWSGPEKHRIANFKKEVKVAGHIDSPEVPIEFEEHVFIAKTPEEVEFIQSSRGFGSACRRVGSLAEARALSAKRAAERSAVVGHPIRTESTDNQEID